MTRGDTWVGYYKGKVPYKEIATGLSKGRSLRAMKDRYIELLNWDNTKDQGRDLKVFYDQCMIIHEHRGGHVDPGMPLATLQVRMESVQRNLGILPAALAQRLLFNAVAEAKAEMKWKPLCAMVNPFEEASMFEIKMPKMSGLPRVPAWKYLSFRTTLFRELIAPMLAHGNEKLAPLVALAEAALSQLDEVEVVDLDQVAAGHYRDAQIALKGLLCCTTMKLSGQYMQELKEVVAAGTKKVEKQRNEEAKSIIGKAINTNPTFQEKKQLMLAAEATLKERSLPAMKVDDHLKKLADGKGEAAADASVAVVCSDVAKLSAVLPMTAISQHADKVLDLVCRHLEPSLCMSGELSQGRLQALRSCCVAACSAYPQSKGLNALQQLCAEKESKISQASRLTALQDSAGSLVNADHDFVGMLEKVEAFTAAYTMCREKSEAQKFVAATFTVSVHLQKVAREIIDGIQKGTLDDNAAKKMTQLMEILGGNDKKKETTIVECVHCFRNMGTVYLDAEASDKENAKLPHISADDLAQLGKNVATFRRAVDIATARKQDGWTSELVPLLEQSCKCMEKYCQKQYQQASAVTGKHLSEMCSGMHKFLDGMHGGHWRKGVAQDCYDALLEQAKATILKMEAQELWKEVEKLEAAVREDMLAKQLAGDAVTQESYGKEVVLKQEAIVLAVEIELFNTLGYRADRAPGLRSSVVSAVKKLRPHKLKDKKVLAEGLWKEAYDILTTNIEPVPQAAACTE